MQRFDSHACTSDIRLLSPIAFALLQHAGLVFCTVLWGPIYISHKFDNNDIDVTIGIVFIHINNYSSLTMHC